MRLTWRLFVEGFLTGSFIGIRGFLMLDGHVWRGVGRFAEERAKKCWHHGSWRARCTTPLQHGRRQMRPSREGWRWRRWHG